MDLQSISDLSTCAFLALLLNLVVRNTYTYMHVVQVNQKNSKERNPQNPTTWDIVLAIGNSSPN